LQSQFLFHLFSDFFYCEWELDGYELTNYRTDCFNFIKLPSEYFVCPLFEAFVCFKFDWNWCQIFCFRG
jgi:hypothetical protein